jgi:hypothetical protein
MELVNSFTVAFSACETWPFARIRRKLEKKRLGINSK